MIEDLHYKQLILNSQKQGLVVAGTDECGKGSIFGPVVAAAVILPPDFYHPDIDDSKKITQSQREVLSKIIKENAVSYSIRETGVADITEMNILQASLWTMYKAIIDLNQYPNVVFIDGQYKILDLSQDIQQHTIIRGDQKILMIAAASILAKNYSDELMENFDQQYPQYNLKSNKGYGSAEHLLAIKTHGITPHHRTTFGPVASLLNKTTSRTFKIKEKN